jgi:hypothetical protein
MRSQLAQEALPRNHCHYCCYPHCRRHYHHCQNSTLQEQQAHSPMLQEHCLVPQLATPVLLSADCLQVYLPQESSLSAYQRLAH